ncbi:SDR family NAD(P)-dependent oxidoreductase [Pseudoneobacillus rhizosphaerae]|uniref:3-oxoacyl-[acyl-carrier-protein] reductase FabG n=1 Tax=Pseudoneobacillus rhizosphaerae TaxID=2880968 RepID=A0A9C7G8U4_9BACI|nr:SDR family NAD(P)-dependent oxidoreductase [Pseudoneobacillus rhizosphaerae]CAG9607718.1 3-oxoacyl-[acyl-carrier-protein] reductase FabG [Pseudoneobacillus rhizosphaerae]
MFQSVNSLQSTVFSDKVVIVTGASHGIGRAICWEFAIRGAHVHALDILETELKETQTTIEHALLETTHPGTIRTHCIDLTNSHAINQLVQSIAATHNNQLDILINNAGGVVGQVHQPIEQVSDQEWQKVMNINLDAAFYMTRSVAPYMKKQHYGRIVNISSGAGRSSSLTGIQAYTSAKAGQIGFTRQMARELGPYGITVNNVAPGFVLSNPSSIKQWENMGDASQKALLEAISVKRLGNPEDIAYPVLFFASDFAKYVSGQIISADGGLQLF